MVWVGVRVSVVLWSGFMVRVRIRVWVRVVNMFGGYDYHVRVNTTQNLNHDP